MIVVGWTLFVVAVVAGWAWIVWMAGNSRDARRAAKPAPSHVPVAHRGGAS